MLRCAKGPESTTDSLTLMLALPSCSETSFEASTSGQEQEDQNALLVGTVELSFAASTRARYLTLNAPVVRSDALRYCS